MPDPLGGGRDRLHLAFAGLLSGIGDRAGTGMAASPELGCQAAACCSDSGFVMSRRVLVSPDSFKGTFSATEVARAIGRGLEHAGAFADLCPVADGGEGTMEILASALGGTRFHQTVLDPIGRPIRAGFGLLSPDRRRAILDMASASGLGHLAEGERDPWSASTYGTGQLIRAAVDGGAREVIIGVGGSATVDGGRGAIEAIADADGIGDARLIVLCDVRTTWERCAEIYRPQKGADERTVRRLAGRLDEFAKKLPRDPRGIAMTGAAGGLAGGLWAALDAELVAGAPFVLDAIAFNDRLRSASCVVVGEGRLDLQSMMGKIVGEIGARARAANIPALAAVGRNELPPDAVRSAGLAEVIEARNLRELELAGARVADWLARAAADRLVLWSVTA